MKILVCVSKTPETTAKIAFSADGKSFSSAGVNFIMNPYDEWYALVRALEVKEQVGGEVIIISVGGTDYDTILRKGLAIGADKAVRVDAEPVSSGMVSAQIAAYAKDQGFDMVLLGKETIDYNGSEVGSMLGELLSMPFVSYASKMDLQGNTATIYRDIEGGEEILEVDTPFVLSAAKGLAEQRIPNMRGIMMAKSKPLEVRPALNYEPKVEVVAFSLPPAKSGVHLVDLDDMDELVRLLHEESKVI